MKPAILFLCTGNSCRSQMAEGFLRHYARDRFEAQSAGTEPSQVNPMAIAVMREKGIDISGHRSKSVDMFVGQRFRYVVTVCDNARQRCPMFPGDVLRLHWPFFDPAEAPGNEPERLQVFRRVRDEIEHKIIEFLDMVH